VRVSLKRTLATGAINGFLMGAFNILAKYERNATGESLNWIPASVMIPLNQTSNEAQTA
jgi:hypothetical protein